VALLLGAAEAARVPGPVLSCGSRQLRSPN
jgi:hypothetical protein